MEGGEECSSNESGWTKYIDPTSDYDDQNNYNRGFVHDDDDVDDDDDGAQHQHHRYHHHHHGDNRRQRKEEDDDDGDSIASDASSGPRHHHGEEEEDNDDDDDGNKFFKGKKSTKVVKGRNTEKYEGKGKKDMTLKMSKSTGYGFKQRQGQKPI